MSEKVKQVKVYDYETATEITVTITIDDQGKKTYIPPQGFVLTDEIVDLEFARARKYPSDLVYWRKTGSTNSLVMRVPTSKEVSTVIRRMNDAESKRKIRERRCLVEGKNGNVRMCDKTTCADCPKAGDLDQTHGRTVSIEDLMENDSGFNPTTGNTTRSTVMAKIETEEFTTLLKLKNPLLAVELRLALEGHEPIDIAKETGTSLQTVYSHRRKIQELKHQYDKEGE